MLVERARADEVQAGDVIAHVSLDGWWRVTQRRRVTRGVRLALRQVDSDGHRDLDLEVDAAVRRAEPDVVHHRVEFLGLTAPEARALAGAFGWAYRNRSEPGLHTDDLRLDRINVWTGTNGRVTRAEFG